MPLQLPSGCSDDGMLSVHIDNLRRKYDEGTELFKAGSFEKAVAVLQQALEVGKPVFVNNRGIRNQLEIRRKIGLCFYHLGSYAEAEKWDRETLSKGEAIGQHSRDAWDSRHNLAKDLLAESRKDIKLVPKLREATDLFRKNFDQAASWSPSSDDVYETVYHLALCFSGQGKYSEAFWLEKRNLNHRVENWKRCIQDSEDEELVNEAFRKMIESRHNYATFLYLSRSFRRANSEFEANLESLKKWGWAERPDMIDLAKDAMLYSESCKREVRDEHRLNAVVFQASLLPNDISRPRRNWRRAKTSGSVHILKRVQTTSNGKETLGGTISSARPTGGNIKQRYDSTQLDTTHKVAVSQSDSNTSALISPSAKFNPTHSLDDFQTHHRPKFTDEGTEKRMMSCNEEETSHKKRLKTAEISELLTHANESEEKSSLEEYRYVESANNAYSDDQDMFRIAFGQEELDRVESSPAIFFDAQTPEPNLTLRRAAIHAIAKLWRASNILLGHFDEPIPVKIAVLDTGLEFSDQAHTCKFIWSRQRQIREYADFTDLSSTEQEPIILPKGKSKWKDCNGHGTRCASLILTVAYRAEIYIARISKDGKQINSASVATAINYAADKWDVDIMSMSFGYPNPYPDIDEALSNATHRSRRSKGQKMDILVFAAASNDGRNQRGEIAWPARNENVVAVYPATANGNKTDYCPAVYGGEGFMALAEHYLLPQLVAKSGKNEKGEPNLDEKIEQCGSSFATPFVAGSVSLLLEFSRVGPLAEEIGVEETMRTYRGIRATLKLIGESEMEKGLYPLQFAKFFDPARARRQSKLGNHVNLLAGNIYNALVDEIPH